MPAPRPPRRLDLWKPSLFSIVCALSGVGLGAILAILSAVMVYNPGSTTFTPGALPAYIAMFGCPPAMLGFFVATIFAGRKIPRGIWLLLCCAASASAGAFLGAGLGVGSDIGTGVAGGTFFCGLPTVLLGVLGVLVLAWGLRSVPGDLRLLQVKAIATALEGRRVVSFEELAAVAGVSGTELPDLVRDTVRASNLPVVVVREIGQVIDGVEDTDGQKKVLGLVRARGRADASQIAKELDVPTTVVIHWVHAVAAAGIFHGALHGETIFSESALTAKTAGCPNCGSPLPAGGGVRRCTYCDAEVF